MIPGWFVLLLMVPGWFIPRFICILAPRSRQALLAEGQLWPSDDDGDDDGDVDDGDATDDIDVREQIVAAS